MGNLGDIKNLKMILIASGIFDLVGAIYFATRVGVGKSIADPPTHQFYALLIATFLFSLAYIQFITALNVKRYLVNIGAVIISRVLYFLLFTCCFVMEDSFAITFLPTAILDLIWAIIYIYFVRIIDEISIRRLFIPKLNRE